MNTTTIEFEPAAPPATPPVVPQRPSSKPLQITAIILAGIGCLMMVTFIRKSINYHPRPQANVAHAQELQPAMQPAMPAQPAATQPPMQQPAQQPVTAQMPAQPAAQQPVAQVEAQPTPQPAPPVMAASATPLVAIPLPTPPPGYQFAPTAVPIDWSKIIPPQYIGCPASPTGGYDCPNGEHIIGYGPNGVIK